MRIRTPSRVRTPPWSVLSIRPAFHFVGARPARSPLHKHPTMGCTFVNTEDPDKGDEILAKRQDPDEQRSETSIESARVYIFG